MSVQKDLRELLEAGIISPEIAGGIENYYRSKPDNSGNRLVIVFGILGAILIGLGIILIIAHNWYDMPRGVKTVLAFVPLLVGQGASLFTLWKKSESMAWREGSAAFLFFAVGASISLISQIYHISGSTGTFLLTWMLLCAPLIYLLRSSIVSLLYIAGSTYYAVETGFSIFKPAESYLYWLLILAVAPHYYLIVRNNAKSNFVTFHNWLLPFSLVVGLASVSLHADEWLTIAFMSLFGLFYLLGSLKIFDSQKLRNNGYLIQGSLGMVILLLIFSFESNWEHMRQTNFWSETLSSPEFIAAVITTVLALAVMIIGKKTKAINSLKPSAFIFLVFIPIFLLGMLSGAAAVLVNILLLALGVYTVAVGIRRDHLGIVNYGLLIITALAVIRFFDQDLSFVLRGILFVLVGLGFFVTNYKIVQSRRKNEK